MRTKGSTFSRVCGVRGAADSSREVECACIWKSERVAPRKRRTKDSGEKCGERREREKKKQKEISVQRARANSPPGRKL